MLQVYTYLLVVLKAKLYIPSTLNIELILWHPQLIVCAENVKSWFKSWVFPFTFQAYILPPSRRDGVHRTENFVEIIPVFLTFSKFKKKKKKLV